MCNQEHSEKVARLVEDALEIVTGAERAAFLETACAGDVALRAEVEDYLRADEAAGGFLRPVAEPGHARQDAADDSRKAGGFKPGDRLGPYHLLGLIGEGGSSTVYLAEQDKPVRRWVALKVVKPGMDTQNIISRFELERQALALMDHPGIAKVLDAGATPQGHPFFVMELVQGMQITNHCDQHCLGIPQRLELFVQVCQGVLHAHQKGIMHRDIKPDNILVCLHDGRAFPKIIDFGIAKVLGEWAFGNTPGTGMLPFLGTPAYMSPEQAQMTMPDLDTRTDIYSLGALLYELLTGYPPFDHGTLMAAGLEEMCRIIRFQDPPSPSVRLVSLPGPERVAAAQARSTNPEDLRRSLVGDLDWICLKALEKERERRYETAASLADDIDRHLQHLPVAAAAPTFKYRFSKLVRRNRTGVAAFGAIALILVGSALVTTRMAVRERSSATRARTQQAAAIEAQQAFHQAMVAMHVSSGLSAAADGNHDRAVLWFANAAQAAGPETSEFGVNRRRALSWLEQVPIPVTAFQLSSAFSDLEFSPCSQYLLAVDRAGDWVLLRCRDQVPLAWVAGVGPVTAVAWDPEGSMLALAQGRALQVRSASDGALRWQVMCSEEPTAAGFTPDGAQVVFGGRTVRVLDLGTGALLDTVWEHPEAVTGFAFSPQSNLVVSVSADGSARICVSGERGFGRFAADTLPHRGSIRTDACASRTKYRQDFLEEPTLSLPAFSRQQLLLTRTGPFAISAWDVSTAHVVRTFEGMCCSCRFVISPDGDFMACGLQNSRVGVWEIATGRPLAMLASRGACILDVAFDPTGEGLATAEVGGTVRTWSALESRETYSAMHHTAEVDRVAFAPDGAWIATAQVDGVVRLWVLPRPNAAGHTLAFDYGPRIVRMDWPRDHFVATKEPAWEAEIRTAAVYSVATGKPLGPSLDLPGALQDAALGPDCNRLALALAGFGEQPPGILQFVEAATGRVIGQTTLGSVPLSLAWDPDGRRVAVICLTGELLVMNWGDEAPAVWSRPTPGSPAPVNPFVAFTPDGESLVSLGPMGRVEVREAATGELRFPALFTEPAGFWSVAIADDSRRIATSTAQGEVRVWDLTTGKQSGSTLTHSGWVYRSRFSPDGTRLLTASHDAKCRIWDLSSGRLSSVPLMHPGEVYDGAFSPDGTSVLTACRDGGVRLWDPGTGQLLAPPYTVGAQAFNVEFTADGRYAGIGSLGIAIHILSLAPLEPDIHWSPNDLCLLAEVVSGSTVAQGAIRDLTTTEWLQRFGELHQVKGNLFRAAWVSRLTQPRAPEPSPPRSAVDTGQPELETAAPDGRTCSIQDQPVCQAACNSSCAVAQRF